MKAERVNYWFKNVMREKGYELYRLFHPQYYIKSKVSSRTRQLLTYHYS